MNVFVVFSQTWLEQLRFLIEHLYRVPKPLNPELNQQTQALINNVVYHYSHYYTVKYLASNYDVPAIFAAPWASPFEQSLRWVAGWRPTTMFQLIISEISTVMDTLPGNIIGDLSEFSSSQYDRLSDLQSEIVHEEDDLTDEMAEWQVDSAIEFLEQEPDVDGMLSKLAEIVKKADDLRLKTLRDSVEMLTPQQAVQLLLAAAELLFGVCDIGMQAD